MKKFNLDNMIHIIVTKRRLIEGIFILLTILSLIAYPFVGVNYDLSTYLPERAETKQALDKMEEEFGYPGMARVMVPNITLSEAKQITEKISDVDGVSMVIGPDSTTDVYMADFLTQNKLTDDFYKDGNACFQIVFKNGDSDTPTHQALSKIYKIAGDDAYFTGSAVSSKERQEAITKEVTMAIGIALVIIFLILTLTTTSWFEPVLFILIMLVAIALNIGTNLMFGTISFFTFSTAAILQLAVSIDYSIFLLHTFQDYKNRGMDVETAMSFAIKDACRSILASGATTIVGFLAMAVMEFAIGKDIGFVLTKGIICSLLTVLLLMPALILRFDALITKTAHRSFIPSFQGLGRFMYKIRRPIIIIALVCGIPCFFGQSLNKFYYGDDAMGAGPGTKYYEDTQTINDVFGKSNMAIAMVPNGSVVKERKLTEALDDLDFNNYALSLSSVLPESIPESFLPKSILKELRTDHYARILISMNTAEESDYAFDCSNQIVKMVRSYYPKDSYVIGMTATTVDIRDILTKDYSFVSILSVLGIIAVVFFSFRSVVLPIAVIIPIEIAVYINMTLPYIMGHTMIYMGYIIVNCIQLGATVDYSILMTNNYLDARKQKPPKDAAIFAIAKSALSIMTSGSILTVVGYLLYFTSSLQSISQIGNLVGRGALLSMLMVLSFLPAALCAIDKLIFKEKEWIQKLKQKFGKGSGPKPPNPPQEPKLKAKSEPKKIPMAKRS